MITMRSGTPWRAALAVLALCLGGVTACSRSTSAPAGKPDQIYTVRGQIVMLPDAAKPANELQIRHEPIPDFVDKTGKVLGMNSMVMPFTPDAKLKLGDFTTGDLVEFTFEVRWKTRPASLVTAMKKLAPDTKLDFGRAAPASGR